MWAETKGKQQILEVYRMGKTYGRLPTEILRDTDFRYLLNKIVLDIGSVADRK